MDRDIDRICHVALVAGYETIPVLITQKEKISNETSTGAQKEVAILQSEVFDQLLGRLYSRLERWNELRSPPPATGIH